MLFKTVVGHEVSRSNLFSRNLFLDFKIPGQLLSSLPKIPGQFPSGLWQVAGSGFWEQPVPGETAGSGLCSSRQTHGRWAEDRDVDRHNI